MISVKSFFSEPYVAPPSRVAPGPALSSGWPEVAVTRCHVQALAFRLKTQAATGR